MSVVENTQLSDARMALPPIIGCVQPSSSASNVPCAKGQLFSAYRISFSGAARRSQSPTVPLTTTRWTPLVESHPTFCKSDRLVGPLVGAELGDCVGVDVVGLELGEAVGVGDGAAVGC